jgi:hypothetical protein
MSASTASKPFLLLAAAALALGLSACSSEPTPAPAPSEPIDTTTETDDASDESALMSDLAMGIEIRLSPQNAKVDWQGSDMRVALDGSINDPNADSAVACQVIEMIALSSYPETAVTLVYSDGEVDCADLI